MPEIFKNGQRPLPRLASRIRLAGIGVGVTEVNRRVGFMEAVADIAEQRERLFVAVRDRHMCGDRRGRATPRPRNRAGVACFLDLDGEPLLEPLIGLADVAARAGRPVAVQ